MLGKNLFKAESNVQLTSDRFRSLIIFYVPLIGTEALALFEFLFVKGDSVGFDEINKILNSLNISVDKFEENIKKLNEFKLVQTLKDKNEDKYIFILNNPLSEDEFIKNDIFVREFILKTSGEYYQSLISNYRSKDQHDNYEDVSNKLDLSNLDDWNPNNEKFLNKKTNNNYYEFNTLFDINTFLNDISYNLLPLKFRNEDNLKEIATLADLYNISPDKMRTFLPKVAKSDSDSFDLSLLRYLCENSTPDYKTVENGEYNIPCLLFMMNKQDGKEVSKYDRKILYTLANSYHLKPDVINVLIEYALNNCDNHLIEKYLYAIASDLNRNGVDNAQKALECLNSFKKKNTNITKTEAKPVYDKANNPIYDEELFNQIMKNRDK